MQEVLIVPLDHESHYYLILPWYWSLWILTQGVGRLNTGELNDWPYCTTQVTLQLGSEFCKMYFRSHFSCVSVTLNTYYGNAMFNVCIKRKVEWPQSPRTISLSWEGPHQNKVSLFCFMNLTCTHVHNL